MISTHELFSPKIDLTQIKQVKEFAGELIIKTDKEELRINAELIEQKELNSLRTELNQKCNLTY
ncbi:hypothetical protein [Robertkochia aurantiaca]|uniref:hypothetical protein n=1 Tax=Robertkochia aurantiaca TaxID=2873700 RepID=UPI001CC96022|nr:hypothetical protein [Robertkochia sp. 3YJGBD-33]